MSSPILGNPIRGVLHGPAWDRPPGNSDFRVTQDAASHAAKINPATGKPRAKALDIGDGDPDRDELLVMHDGVVAEARIDGSANLSIDFMHEGVKWRVLMAHNTLPHPLDVGDTVAEGDTAGHVGDTGAAGQLHCHIQVGFWDGTAWVWVDPWPLLAQNQETDMLQGKVLGHLVNSVVTVEANDTNFRAAPATGTTPKLAQFPAGTLFYPDYLVEGAAVPAGGSKRWFAGFGQTAKGIELGYLHESVVTEPAPAQVTGHTDAELAAAAKAAAHFAATDVSGAAAAAAVKYPG